MGSFNKKIKQHGPAALRGFPKLVCGKKSTQRSEQKRCLLAGKRPKLFILLKDLCTKNSSSAF
jgi:hypothetical protein